MRIVTPTTTNEALGLLDETPDLIPIAGGTDLLVHWPVRVEARDLDYLDLSRLDGELRAIRWLDDAVTLGALTTFWDVVTDDRFRSELPILVEAARQLGAVQIQTRGTWAGNIVNASPAADGVPVLMAVGAQVELTSVGGATAAVPLDEFYTGYRQTVRKPNQLVTKITIPRGGFDAQFFEKIGPRRAQAITKVGVAATHTPDSGWRVVANSMAPTVKRCPAVEALLDSDAPIRSPDDLQPAVDRDTTPIDDIRSTGRYRRIVFARVLYHALRTRSDRAEPTGPSSDDAR